MYQIINVLIIVVAAVCLLTNKKSVVNFRISDYLSTMIDKEKKESIPYLRGIFIIGLLIPALAWVIDSSNGLLMDRLQQTKAEEVHAYEYIGRCYVMEDCRHIVLNNPVKTDEELVLLTGQIKQYMISSMSSESNVARSLK